MGLTSGTGSGWDRMMGGNGPLVTALGWNSSSASSVTLGGLMA